MRADRSGREYHLDQSGNAVPEIKAVDLWDSLIEVTAGDTARNLLSAPSAVEGSILCDA